MRHWGSFVVLVLCAFSASGCCRACNAVGNIAKEISGPEAADGEKLVKERVANDKELRKRICGVDTKELVDLVVKKDSVGNYSIEGTPVERPPAKAASSAQPAPSSSATPIVNAGKTLHCAAVVSMLWDAKEEPGGTKWSIRRLDVDQITTPGLEYKRPAPDFD